MEVEDSEVVVVKKKESVPIDYEESPKKTSPESETEGEKMGEEDKEVDKEPQTEINVR